MSLRGLNEGAQDMQGWALLGPGAPACSSEGEGRDPCWDREQTQTFYHGLSQQMSSLALPATLGGPRRLLDGEGESPICPCCF